MTMKNIQSSFAISFQMYRSTLKWTHKFGLQLLTGCRMFTAATNRIDSMINKKIEIVLVSGFPVTSRSKYKQKKIQIKWKQPYFLPRGILKNGVSWRNALQNGEELTEFGCEDSSSEVEEVEAGGRYINWLGHSNLEASRILELLLDN